MSNKKLYKLTKYKVSQEEVMIEATCDQQAQYFAMELHESCDGKVLKNGEGKVIWIQRGEALIKDI